MQPPRDHTTGVKDAFAVLMGAAGRRSTVTKQQQEQQLKRRQSCGTEASNSPHKRQRDEHPPQHQLSSAIGCQHAPSHQQTGQQHTPIATPQLQQHASPAPPSPPRSARSQRPAAVTDGPTATSKAAAVEAFKRAFSGGLTNSKRPEAQLFDYLLVYDLEATTNKTRTLHPIEIIELSCVIVQTATASITASFQSYVRPTEHPQLDPFVTELCGITQQQVNQAPLLADVLQQHHAWLQGHGVLQEGVSCVPVTWTGWDLKVALCTECGWRRIQRPTFLCRWVDLKVHFRAMYKKAGNLKSCVEAAGLTWQGRAHSGLDDATNTANLAIHLMRWGVQFEVTQVSENPPIQPVQQAQQQGSPGDTRNLQPSEHDLAAHSVAAAAAAAARGQAGSCQGSPARGAAACSPSTGSKAAGQGAPSPGRRSMAQLARTKGVSGVYDSSGRWLGRCFCRVRAKQRVTKRPGPNHGRQFWSCGRWTITKQQSSACEFFLWVDDVPAGSIKGAS